MHLEYNVTLNLLAYLASLWMSGTIGSIYQAYKATGDPRPFWARVIVGVFAGTVTFAFIDLTGLSVVDPLVRFGVAAILGVICEKGDTEKIEKVLNGAAKAWKG